MRKSGFLLVAMTLLWAMAMPAADAAPTSKTVTVHIPRLHQGVALTGEPTLAWVRFGGSFTSIQELTFHVVMRGDLLDPGENFNIDGRVGGQVNLTSEPMSEFDFTISPAEAIWLDGRQLIHPSMRVGTVRIVDFTATIFGAR